MIEPIPWNVRLNEHFVLSDFMYSDTIIRRGLKNPYHIRPVVDSHGRALADLLGHIADEHGHLSIVYGYICHDVSMKTVKWRNPADPSYHRWDMGAAADFIAHDWVVPQRTQRGVWCPMEDPDASPMMLAREIAASHDFSRMITYSESPAICLAANSEENSSGKHRRAFYENRYEGRPGQKPRYLKYNGNGIPSRKEVRAGLSEHGWIGKGHPTYHGKGRMQYQHVRVGKYLTLLECLRCPQKLADGVNNRPPHNDAEKRKFMHVGYAMSRFIEWYYHFVGLGSISVISGHNSWTENLYLERHYREVADVSRNWGSGEGSMIFSIDEDYGPEFGSAWLRHGMEDYHVDYYPTEGSLTIKVTWRKA